VFRILAPWWPSGESDRTETWSGFHQGFICGYETWLANARTDDGRHLIVKAHRLDSPASLGIVPTPSLGIILMTRVQAHIYILVYYYALSFFSTG
jgi:hypothetical protein